LSGNVHFASEIEKEDYENSKNILVQNKIISEIGKWSEIYLL